MFIEVVLEEHGLLEVLLTVAVYECVGVEMCRSVNILYIFCQSFL